MVQEIHPTGDEAVSQARDKKKNWQINALVLGGVFLLGAVLPPRYKGFAPLLFLLPYLINSFNKQREGGVQPKNPQPNRNYTPYAPRPTPSADPYSYKPKDAEDPRKYKPIG